ncbi:hypothetical protein SAMN04487950_3857 [Halogranum rubrum]|uniref:MarR family protein n=1 Tax=Halogranum rubrum TaxID=553466 RepID=A0A1I4HUZ7_9EURY|nr:hypothetical protein [Halogranum rubrum]SFL45995.1 hypothetical protein SAMN04487950_3857 [Halogranum rubrum]
MPNSGENPSKRIVIFLSENKDQQFATPQVVEETGLTHAEVATILPQLRERRLVVHEDSCWEITDDTERLSNAYSLHRSIARLDERYGSEEKEMWDEYAPDIEDHPNYDATNG